MTRHPLPIAILLAALLAIAPLARASFTIAGQLPSLAPDATLSLARIDLAARSQLPVASIPLQPDRSFSLQLDEPAGLFSLDIPGQGKVELAIASGQSLAIAPDPAAENGLRVTGSPDTTLLHAYESFRKASLARLVYPPRAALRQANVPGADPQLLAERALAEVQGYDAHRRELNDFVLDQVGPSLALYATSARWDRDHRIDEIAALVATFAQRHPEHPLASQMQQRLARFAATAKGALAPDIAGAGLDGQPVSLAALRGKVVLVDFWASWCTPCRIENLRYRELRQAYSERGFEILAVNLDTDPSRWRAASERDQADWPQVSDPLAFNSPLAQAYDVAALPATFLVGPDGRILARDLRGPALPATLDTLLP